MNTQSQTNKVYSTYKQNVQKYFEGVAKIIRNIFKLLRDYKMNV
jgi:hypothetical protein